MRTVLMAFVFSALEEHTLEGWAIWFHDVFVDASLVLSALPREGQDLVHAKGALLQSCRFKLKMVSKTVTVKALMLLFFMQEQSWETGPTT